AGALRGVRGDHAESLVGRARRASRQILEPKATNATTTSVYTSASLHHPQLRYRGVDARDRTQPTAIHDERSIQRRDQVPYGPLPPNASSTGRDGNGG